MAEAPGPGNHANGDDYGILEGDSELTMVGSSSWIETETTPCPFDFCNDPLSDVRGVAR